MEPSKNQFSTDNGFGGKILRQPRKAMSGIVYSAAIVLMLVISLLYSFILTVVVKSSGVSLDEMKTQDWYKYLSYLLYQVVYIITILLFAFLYRQKPCAFGYRKTHWKYFILAGLLVFGLLFSLNWVNGQFIALLEKLGYKMPESSLPSLAGGGLAGVLLVVAVLPAIMEETIFRGIILDGIKDIGTVAACLLGGLLFSIFHQNPAQTIYQFICGAAFTLVAIRADSIFPTIFMHFVNNALIILDEKYGFFTNMSGAVYITVCVLSALSLIGALVYLIFFDKKTNRKKEGEIKPFIYPAMVGVILCAVMWVSSLVTGISG